MNRYATYKDIGIPWLGEIPEHWIIMPIKFSLSMPITDGPHETPEILSDGIPFISAEAVKNDKLDFNKKRGYISEEDNVKFSKKYSPKKGDIYMVKSGATTGNVAKVETDEVFNIWSPLAVMRPDKNRISTEFLFYAIKSDYFNTSVQLKWNMGTQQNIGMGILSNIRVVVPPTDEQTAIAHYLDTKLGEIDALIDKQQTLLEKLAEQRTAVITHAVTKGLNPAAPMKNSGVEWLGNVPAHWDIVGISKLFMLKAGGDLQPDFFSREKDDEHCYPIYTNANDEHAVYGYTSKKRFNADSITVSGRGDIGFAVYRDHDFDAIIRLLVLSPLKKLDCKYYTYSINALLDFKFESSAVAQLSTVQLAQYKLLLPSYEEQAAIADYLDQETAKIDRLCDTVNQTIGRLKEYRTALITQAVTGKIKVTDE